MEWWWWVVAYMAVAAAMAGFAGAYFMRRDPNDPEILQTAMISGALWPFFVPLVCGAMLARLLPDRATRPKKDGDR